MAKKSFKEQFNDYKHGKYYPKEIVELEDVPTDENFKAYSDYAMKCNTARKTGNYVILTAMNQTELLIEVNFYIDELGYKPAGGIEITLLDKTIKCTYIDSRLKYTQALVKGN
jgi:hypothetical protein